ncbi:MAG: hypothetical protein ABI790_15700 [Betaproteobacteria bacterium]
MISDDKLLLYHYADGLDAAERQHIGAALAAQPGLAARLQNMIAQLDAAAAVAEVPVPVSAQQRWQSSLARVARQGLPEAHGAGRLRLAAFGWLAGAAALGVVLLVTSVGLGIYSTRGTLPGLAVDAPIAIAANSLDASRYERGLQWHLAQTEQQLAGLGAVSGEERLRQIDKIIAQNRLYAMAADRANEARLARVLRSFTPILESLTEDRAGSGEFEGGLAQLNFELKVMQARLATATTAPGQVLAL